MSFLDRMFFREKASGAGSGGPPVFRERPKHTERLGTPEEFALDVKRRIFNEVWLPSNEKGKPRLFSREPIDKELVIYQQRLESTHVTYKKDGAKVVNKEIVKGIMIRLILEMKKNGLIPSDVADTFLEENAERYSKKSDLSPEEKRKAKETAFDEAIAEGHFSSTLGVVGSQEGTVPNTASLKRKGNGTTPQI
jgi:hypothetical protein